MKKTTVHIPTIMQPPGLGDVVAGATKAVGIQPCGKCQRRRQALNAATPGWVARLLAAALGWAVRLRAAAREAWRSWAP